MDRITVGSCWRLRRDADARKFREAVAALCASHLAQSGVSKCQAYWSGERDVTIETLASDRYFSSAPPRDVCAQVYALSSLAEHHGTFSW